MKNITEYLNEKKEDDVCPKCGKNPSECDKHDDDTKDDKDKDNDDNTEE